jgi:hypothetical protein
MRAPIVGETHGQLLHSAAALNGPTDIALTFADYIAESNQNARRFEQLTRFDSLHAVLAGGTVDDSQGWFVRPTVLESTESVYVDFTLPQQEPPPKHQPVPISKPPAH